MKVFLTLAMAAAFITGCASIERAQHHSTEQMLAAAGFKILPANTPQRKNNLSKLPPYTISRQLRGDNVYYVYPEREGRLAYIGNQAA